MSYQHAAVLLAGDTGARSTILRKWLRKAGCAFQVASSYEDACAWLTRADFDLVLCNYQLVDRTAFPLLDWLEGTRSSLVFCARSGRESTWLPVIERGVRRLDRPALKAANLPSALRNILNGRIRRRSARTKVSTHKLEQIGVG